MPAIGSRYLSVTTKINTACLLSHMPSQLFLAGCLVVTKISWMDFFVKHLNEGWVLMFLELKTSCVKLILNYSVRHQIRGTVCIYSCPPQKKYPKKCSPPLEIAGTVTHCHTLNSHCTKTPS